MQRTWTASEMSNGLAVMLLSVVDDVKEGLEFFPTAVVQVSMYVMR